MAAGGDNVLPIPISTSTAFIKGWFGRDTGPEATLYLPGPWLHKGSDGLVLFDALANGYDQLGSVDHSIYIDLRLRQSTTANDK